MFKELQKIFQRESLMEEALNDSYEMLNEDWDMYRAAVKSLRESDTAEVDIDIQEKDIKINKYEREVRKKVITHLAVSGVGDLNVGLVLISIVVDIERIGDYTKNIVELAQHHPGRLSGGTLEEQIKDTEEIISRNFGILIEAIDKSHEELAKNLLDDLWNVKKQCDKCHLSLLHEEVDVSVGDAVALTLYLRYQKRVASHLMNIASSIINPFHKIGYRAKNEID